MFAAAVAQYSYGAYSGNLYQVMKIVDNSTLDIAVQSAGGFADSASQDKFCGAAHCVITKIYDQSPGGNHLGIAPPGGAHRATDSPCNATKERLKVGGHSVYAAYFEGGMGYRNDTGTGIARNDEVGIRAFRFCP
jgi:hypothetical protein